jgi:hypothetical protein
MLFSAELEKHPDLDAAFFWLPFSVEKEFGSRGLTKVRGTINGQPYRSSLMPAGDGRHCMGLRKELRKKLGVDVGDVVSVTMEPDLEERVIEIPPELASLLDSDPAARAFFDGLSYTHRKEYVQWVTDAKKAETRAARLAKVLPMLRDGVKHP